VSGRAARGFAGAAVAVAVVWAACLWRVVAAIDQHGVDLLVMDQWDFLVPLFDGNWSALEKFRFQFDGSPHRMGVGWPLIEAAAWLSGWSNRVDGFVIAGVLALAALLAVWLKVRLTGQLEVWDAIVPVVFLTLRQWGTFLDTPDVSLGAMPVLLLVLTGLALTVRAAPARVALLLALDLACVYTGFGLFAGIVIPTLLVREWWLGRVGPVAGARALALSVAFGLSYFVGFDAAPATGPVAAGRGVGDYAVYASNLFVSAFGVRSSLAAQAVSLCWPVLLLGPLGVAAGRLLSRDPSPAPAVVWLLAGFGVLFVVANTLGRIAEGLQFAFTPRYVTLLVPTIFGLYLALHVFLRGRARVLGLAVFALVWLGGERAVNSTDAPAMESLAAAKRDWIQCYFQTRDVARCNATGVLTLYPYPDEIPRIERQLAWLEERGLNLFAHSRPALPEIEHVLLVSIDTLRADHTGWHGYARETTPVLSALAQRGVVFAQAMSTSSWTLPSHASLLTGRYPSGHGAQDDGSRLADAVPTLAERFQSAGIHTLGVVSHVYVGRPFGFARGFDRFDDSLTEEGTTNPRGDAVVDRFLAHLDGRPADARFFGFVHLFDPHWDYDAPPPDGRAWVPADYAGPIDGRYETMVPFLAGEGATAADREALVAYYDGEVRWVDRQLGRLVAGLDARGLASSTLLVVTSDHGEEFFDHGRLGHGRTVYQEQLHVPLLFHHRALAPEWRREPVSAVDVAPTLLDLAGLPVPEALPGQSLRELAPGDRVLFAESIRFGIAWRAARMGDAKVAELAEAGGRAFFDLARDPGERKPLRRDPTGGALGEALLDFAAAADRGWHWRIVARGEAPVRFRARFETPGQIVAPRHFASGGLGGPEVAFDRFELSPEGRSLSVDVVAVQHTGSIRFETVPADAPVTLAIERLEGGALYAGDGSRLAGSPLRLQRDDSRLAEGFAAADALGDGVHVRTVPEPPRAEAPALSEDARRHLEALGYGAGGGDGSNGAD